VEALAGFGVSETDIAKVVAVDVEALRQLYPFELEAAPIKANARVAENLFRRATGEGREAVIAAIFWAERLCSRRPRPNASPLCVAPLS
jgi:hypothetical protein